MKNKAKLALAAAMIFGSASFVLAGEGSADLSYPPGYDLSHSAPQHDGQRFERGRRDDARDAYGYVGQPTVGQPTRPDQDDFAGRGSAYWQHGNGGIDNN